MQTRFGDLAQTPYTNLAQTLCANLVQILYTKRAAKMKNALICYLIRAFALR